MVSAPNRSRSMTSVSSRERYSVPTRLLPLITGSTTS